MRRSPKDIYQLEKDAQFRVRQDFVEFSGNLFRKGELLTFEEHHFLPHHGGDTLVFKERKFYLQEEENAGILESFSDYLGPASQEVMVTPRSCNSVW